jgi:hypothetical protein
MSATSAAISVEVDTRLSGGQGATTLVPQDNWQCTLSADGCSQARSVPALGCGTTFVIDSLADNDHARTILGSQGGDGGGVYRARDVAKHGQGIGDRAGWVAQGNTQVFFSRVNGEDAHRSIS